MDPEARKQVLLAQDIVSSMQVRVLTEAQTRDQLARVAKALARALEIDQAPTHSPTI